jgi:hypothetical protein
MRAGSSRIQERSAFALDLLCGLREAPSFDGQKDSTDSRDVGGVYTRQD